MTDPNTCFKLNVKSCWIKLFQKYNSIFGFRYIKGFCPSLHRRRSRNDVSFRRALPLMKAFLPPPPKKKKCLKKYLLLMKKYWTRFWRYTLNILIYIKIYIMHPSLGNFGVWIELIKWRELTQNYNC